MTRTPLTATSSGNRPLRCPGLPAGVGLRRASVCAAVDRPDRLELEVVDNDAERPLERQGGGPLRAGRPIELWLEESLLFAGSVESCALRMDREGSRWLSVAYAEYEGRRRLQPEDTYYQLSDAEIARRIACELGLRPRVEATFEVHDRIDRRGDPLRFLRRRARRIGFDLAVAAGELFFCRRVPSLSDPPLCLDRRSPLIGLTLEDRGAGGRGGSFEVLGEPAWRPLIEFDLRDMGPAWDGRYRALRCRHHMDPSGFRSSVDFLEEGADTEGWKQEGFRRDG